MIKFYLRYKQTIKTVVWGIVGLTISLSIIKVNQYSLFAWPLFILSALMFALAARYYLIEKNQKNK